MLVRVGASSFAQVFNTTFGIASGPIDFLVLIFCRSLRTPCFVILSFGIGGYFGGKFWSVVGISLVNTDLNWFTKMDALVSLSLYKSLPCFNGETPILSRFLDYVPPERFIGLFSEPFFKDSVYMIPLSSSICGFAFTLECVIFIPRTGVFCLFV